MAWNEPGGGNKDPWSGKSGGGGESGPPDLDEVVRKLQEKLGGLFGGNRPGGNKSGGGGGGFNLPTGNLGKPAVAIVLGAVLLVWLATGTYIIAPAERGVVLRFGKYVDTTDPGLNWHIPYPIESVEKVNVDLENGKVTVDTKAGAKLDDATVTKTIVNAGYAVTEITRR